MAEYIEKAKAWITEHKAMSIIAGLLLLFVLVKKFKGGSPRRRRRSLPRSVGMRKARRSVTVNRSVNRIVKSGRHRGKKAWQIKGSPEARRHMAAIRRKRSRKLF